MHLGGKGVNNQEAIIFVAEYIVGWEREQRAATNAAHCKLISQQE
jgi:hypothetical protein